MEIERINENTVKFYISYVDIENRGFEKEEIWYNRERSEQLFWQMMDEVNYKEDFQIEGPLWIQVQALEKGLEIIVTKAKLSNNHSFDAFDDVDGFIDITISDKIKSSMIGSNEDVPENTVDDIHYDTSIWFIAEFDDIENVIELSHYFNVDYTKDLETSLFYYEDKYYLYIEIPVHLFEIQEDIISQVMEYGEESDVTEHVLEEYGTLILRKDVFHNLKEHFQ